MWGVDSGALDDVRTGPASNTEWVVRRVRVAITDGELSPGEPLRANELARRWGMSPTPVREAFQRLAADGFLVYSTHRGVRVAPISPDELEELIDLRMLVEPTALRRSLERADDAWRSEVEGAGAVLRAAYRARPFDRSDYEAAHHDFHAALVANAGPTWWPRISTLLRDQTARYRAVDVRPRDLTLVMAEHERLVELSLAGDIEAAVGQLQAHIEASRDQVRQSLARRAGAAAAARA
jgi:GntR family carbon starvation induced transcriptional regulator